MQQLSDAEFEEALQNEDDFIQYIRLLKPRLHRYIVFVLVGDTAAGPAFSPEYAAEFMETFNLKTNLADKYRLGYAAIIGRGTVVFEQLSKNPREPVVANCDINGNKMFLYSGGFYSEGQFSTSSVLIMNGQIQMSFSRGLAFAVYDSTKNELVDVYNYDGFNGFEKTMNPFKYKNRLKEFSPLGGGGGILLLQLPVLLPYFNGKLTRYQQLIIDRVRRNKTILDEYEEVFAKDLSPLVEFCNTPEDLKDLFAAPPSYIGVDGARYYEDYHTRVLNTKNGRRLTTDQPEDFEHSLYIIGGCVYFGFGVPDRNTFASYLQRKFNENGKKFIVHNYGEFLLNTRDLGLPEKFALLDSIPLKKGDIVIFEYPCPIPDMMYLDLSQKSQNAEGYGELFWDMGHLAPEGNRLIADNVYDFLEQKNLLNPPLSTEPVAVKRVFRTPTNAISEKIAANLDDNAKKLLLAHKERLGEFYGEHIAPKVGCIVMNCNPFTLGHRYLAEEALKRCDKLIVFVVEEDKSVFPFKDRFKLVKENLADLKNAYVLPSGSFIISSRTFEEYFNKENMQERRIDTTLDVTLFALEIAPAMGITVRFAGEEPFDKVTQQYNRNMEKLLPRYGIEFIEIPRLKQKDKVVSATEVRRLLEERNFEKIKELVPEKTFEYLENQ